MKTAFPLAFLSMLGFVYPAVCMLMIASAIGVQLSVGSALMARAILVAVLLPIYADGIGTREVALHAIFGLTCLPGEAGTEVGISLSTVQLIYVIYAGLGACTVVFYFRKNLA